MANGKSQQAETATIDLPLNQNKKTTIGLLVNDRPGVLSEIPHVRFARAAVIVGRQDKAKLMRFLRPWARVTRRTVLLTSSDQSKLFPDAPGP